MNIEEYQLFNNSIHLRDSKESPNICDREKRKYHNFVTIPYKIPLWLVCKDCQEELEEE